ncbi:trypsin-like serine peptidase [Streptomyces sp. 4.24]|uniref:trypsin-like serine peptidase n=1 Tax=Streptomyces tritrimontium TaxID=3406573 RepID=UPI003BB52D04
MRRTSMRGALAAAAAAVLLMTGTGAAPPTPAPDADQRAVAEALAFWTPERIAGATPVSGRGEPPEDTGRPRGERGVGRTAAHFAGVRTVGVLFGRDSSLRAHFCTASVVASPGKNLILTANHCTFTANTAFVPNYNRSKNLRSQPYGIWPVKEWFKYAANKGGGDVTATSDLDFAFGKVSGHARRKLQDVTGANTPARTPRFDNRVTVIGYPKIARNPTDLAVRCATDTVRLAGYHQMRIDCAGMWGGVSGGPWFSSLDRKTGRGTIIGNVGGHWGGGPKVPSSHPMYHRITYSPVYSGYFFTLYEDAKAGRRNHEKDRYRQPRPSFGMGNGSTWKHARLMASGDYTGRGRGRGDLVVVWSDGEVTLYTGDGDNGFSGERRLKAANGTWKHAKTITGGDFAGGGLSDLLVVWSDGESSLYPDAGGAGGLGGEVRMAPAGSVWKYAEQIVGGAFGTAGALTDVVVRWQDGEVTGHTRVGRGTFGRERRLMAPNALLRRGAAVMTAGDFSGNDNWDLTVRRSDGSLVQYQDTSASGLGKTVRMRGPGRTWPHAAVMTAGGFNGNGHPDDLVVRWSDGETTLHANCDTALGSEHTLVPAAARKTRETRETRNVRSVR